jgi:hypothetical protein
MSFKSISFFPAFLTAVALHLLVAGLLVFSMPVRRDSPADLFFWGSILQARDLLPYRELPSASFLGYTGNEQVVLVADWPSRFWQKAFSLSRISSPDKVLLTKPDAAKFSGPRVEPDTYLSEVQSAAPLKELSGEQETLPRMRYIAP